MAANTLAEPARAIEIHDSRNGKSAAQRIFESMRGKIAGVFPDDDREAWQWTDENYEVHEIERPFEDFRQWLHERYQGSDEFSKRLVRRMFTIWEELEKEGFRANDLALYEHQKALFAWIALSTATGVRDEIANLLVRSPYGSGKSLVAGLVVRAFKETQEEMIAEGADPKEIPTGALLGLRKEHMLQNAMGQQYAVLQPPYTVERADINAYRKNLTTMFGDDFRESFPRPRGVQHPFYRLFQIGEDDDDLPPAAERLRQYRTELDEGCWRRWKKVNPKKRQRITETLEALMEGKIVLVPDAYNVPQAEKPLPREGSITDDDKRYRGDSAHALTESAHYRVKATHRHLALDRNTYTTKVDSENPAQFCIAYGSMLSRAPENMRADVREEILRRCRLLVIDEAGKNNPGSLADSTSELSGHWPVMVGFTGQDRGIDGWTARSPVLSTAQTIRLKLSKPIAFAGIGDPASPPEQGTEEAWSAYRKVMFRNEDTAEELGLPQPHELDSVIIAPPKQLREYAHRIIRAHKKREVPAKVWCFDPEAGDSRWNVIVSGFNAPKSNGDPKRILVAPPSQASEALHLRAECYDVLTRMNSFALDQLRGRLGHIRNTERTAQKQERARTYFRVQWLQGQLGEAYIRTIAQSMGYGLPDENAHWVPLQCMIDRDAYERDRKRLDLSAPEPIPDTRAVQKRKKRWRHFVPDGTPLKSTSAYVLDKERKRSERLQRQGLREQLGGGNDQPFGSSTVMDNGDSSRIKTPEHFTARLEKVSAAIHVDASGMPTNLEELARDFCVSEYTASLEVKAEQEHRNGVRGEALAMVVLKELQRLTDVVARRSWHGSSESEQRSTKYVNVNL